MTRDELTNLAYLPNELKCLNMELEKLKHPPRIMDRRQADEYTAALNELRAVLQKRRDYCASEIERLRAYIDGIQDPFTREILRLRFADGKTWVQVSAAMGGMNTDDNLKQICYRHFLKEGEKVDG